MRLEQKRFQVNICVCGEFHHCHLSDGFRGDLDMKWNEMTTGKKVLFVIALICGLACLVLTLLDNFNIWAAPKAIGPALFGTFWICGGILQKNKILAICYYVLGAAWFFLSLLHIF